MRIPRRVIDFHAHFVVPGRLHDSMLRWERNYVRRFGEEKLKLLKQWQRENIADRWKGLGEAEHQVASTEESVRLWREEVDRHGLEAIVFVTGGGNDHLASVVRQYPGRFFGFAHHDPFEPNAAAELERAVLELGLSGYKVIAPLLTRPINDPAAYPVWEVAQRLGIPVLIHFGILGGGGAIAGAANCNPLLLEEVAHGFPTVPFVIPHFGAGYMRELLLLSWSCRNVYVDTSGSLQWTRWMPVELSLTDVLRRFLETIGPERIIFGTDSSVLPRGFIRLYYEEMQRACWTLNLDEEEEDMIFYRNAARLLKVPAAPAADRAAESVRVAGTAQPEGQA